MTLPLSTLLSHALVAFTIETDNLFEQQMPHFTTEALKAGQPPRGPWLISLAFWSTCLKYVSPTGTSVGEVLDRGFMPDSFLLGNNPGMVRWGYLSLAPGTSSSRRPNRGWTVTPAGQLAQKTWAPLPELVESRWVRRWPDVKKLRTALLDVVAQAEQDLPDHIPINGGNDGRVTIPARPPSPPTDADIAVLLAKALLLFTIEAEAISPVPLVHAANVLRVLKDRPVAQRDLPAATGVAKETLAVMVGQLQKQGLISLGAAKTFALTKPGQAAADAAAAAVASVEARWPSQLRDHLEPLVGDGTVNGSALAEAIRPLEGSWRQRRPTPTTLPHHPAVSHRGGYPDGS